MLSSQYHGLIDLEGSRTVHHTGILGLEVQEDRIRNDFLARETTGHSTDHLKLYHKDDLNGHSDCQETKLEIMWWHDCCGISEESKDCGGEMIA